jgi:hypothetical protein
MDFFGLVDAIRDYCEDEGIFIIYGSQAYANAQADAESYSSNELILIADFSCVPTITGGQVVALRYSGVISLGQKTETVVTDPGEETETSTTTISNLDETPIQKYDRRLKYLSTKLAAIIGELSCDNELDVSGLNFRFDLNKLDLNADFVATPITLEQ